MSPLDTLHAQRDAWNRGDLAGYLDGCAADITYLSSRSVVTGRDALAASLRAAYPDPAAMGQLTLTILSVEQHPAVAHVSLCWGVSTATEEVGGVALVVLQLRDGRWWLTHDATLRSPRDPDTSTPDSG